MAKKIKFLGNGDSENKGRVCFVGVISDHTLCGDSMDGDWHTVGGWSSTTDKVNCSFCCSIVDFCKKVKRSEY